MPKKKKEKITEPTWVVHCVFPEEDDITAVGEGFGNNHTHGLDNYGHRELCMPFAIEPKVACLLLNDMGFAIVNEGSVFEEGRITGFLKNDYDLMAISFDDDPTLYILVPDKNNKFPDDEGCEMPFLKQVDFARRISRNKDYV